MSMSHFSPFLLFPGSVIYSGKSRYHTEDKGRDTVQATLLSSVLEVLVSRYYLTSKADDTENNGSLSTA